MIKLHKHEELTIHFIQLLQCDLEQIDPYV